MRWNEQRVSLPIHRLREGQKHRLGVSTLARDQARSHLGSSSLEQGGLLLGRLLNSRADAQAPIEAVCIDLVAPATQGIGSEVSLTMPTSVWDSARGLLEEHRDKVIVGWYHSHPGLTAFFSSTDKATQKAFFNHPWSIGWVIDPFIMPSGNGAEAFFIGPDSKRLEISQLVEPDDLFA